MVSGRKKEEKVHETQSMRQEDQRNDDDEELIKRSVGNGSRLAAGRRRGKKRGDRECNSWGGILGERMDDVRG